MTIGSNNVSPLISTKVLIRCRVSINQPKVSVGLFWLGLLAQSGFSDVPSELKKRDLSHPALSQIGNLKSSTVRPGEAECLPCPVGNFYDSATSGCAQCDPGQYQEFPGQ